MRYIMDEKHNHRLDIIKDRRQRKDAKSYMHSISSFLHTQKQSLLTGFLLIVAAMLLFGIFSQFQPPRTSMPPDGATVLDYRTFLEQVKARNVLAVVIQGDEIHGLLATPFQGRNSPKITPGAGPSSKYTADIEAWNRYVSGYPSRSHLPSPPPIDSRRVIYTLLPGSGDANFIPLLLNSHVVVKTLPVAQLPAWLMQLWKSIPTVFFILILLLAFAPKGTSRSFRSLDDRITGVGKNRTHLFERVKETAEPRQTEKKTASDRPAAKKVQGDLEPPTTFADVAGIDEVRIEVEEIVQFLRSPERFSRLGARIPRGALLVGPPGTGKTLLAKAVAGEAGVPFFSMSASEFVEMIVGVGASRVRNLFNEARRSAPCVVFIDELDAVGRQRSMGMMGNDERDQTLNQLLVELDGFDSRQAVVVLAATNRVDILDKALLRPGRFDRHITLSLPDRVGRAAILKVHMRHTPLHEDVSLERLSRLTTGMSGADLANLVNEAALAAARQDLERLSFRCFEEALARVQLGALRPLVMSEADRRIIAFHEGGHALVAYHLPQADTVNRVTILPRGQSLGVTQFTAEEDRYNYSRETLMARIAVGLGGRVSEELTFGPERVTTGAENDLQMVTDLARRMGPRWGMSEQVGVVFANYEPGAMSLTMRPSDVNDLPAQSRSFVVGTDGQLTLDGSDATAHRHAFAMNASGARGNNSTTMASMIDSEVQNILKEGYAMARALLSEHYEQLKKLANALMEYEQLDRKQFEALVQE